MDEQLNTEDAPAPAVPVGEPGERLFAWAARPGIIALLWMASFILLIIDQVMFPGDKYRAVSSVLYLAATPVFAALVTGWIMGVRAAVLNLIATFLCLDIAVRIIWFVAQFFLSVETATSVPVALGMLALYLLLFGGLIWRVFTGTRGRGRRVGAIIVFMLVVVTSANFADNDRLFFYVSGEARALLPSTAEADENEEPEEPTIEADRLWGAQPALIDSSLAAIRPRKAGQPTVYAMAVAAQGTQDLFGREAHTALRSFAGGFGAAYGGGVLLSNARADQLRAPLATRESIGAVTTAIAERMNPDRDVLLVYLAAHGGRDAALSSDLPDYSEIQPINAGALAEALKKSRVRRKVIIISACYSGAWIPALAGDDTIVITAAAKDRTSFGCSDERQMTYFGEAFLRGPLRKGASLRQAFDSGRATIARWEKRDGLTPSNPQASIGKNMRAFWSGGIAPTATPR